MKNISKEDYLRAIDRIAEKKKDIRSTDLGKELRVSKPSVCAMIKKLQAEGLLVKRQYASLKLTPKGESLARRLTAKHRIIEVFLKKILAYKKDIHEEAHKLEHAFSDKSVRRLKKFLKNPKICPHGKKIP